MITYLALLISASAIEFFADPVVYRAGIEIEDTIAHTITKGDVFYLEFNCEIPYQELHYQTADDIIYANATIPFRIADLDRPDSLVDTLYRQFTIPSFAYAAREQISFLVQFGTYLPEGRFQYRIEMISGDKTGALEGDLDVRKTDYGISDICLASDIVIDTTGDQMRKGDLRVTPRPSRRFGGRFENLYFYYELYDIVPGTDTLAAVYKIVDAEGRTVRRVSRTVEKNFASQAVNCGIAIKDLDAGEYTLIVAIEDQDTVVVGQKQTAFNVTRSERKEVSYEGMPFYDEIEYFLTPHDYGRYKDLPADGKRAFLERFWRIHDYYAISERFEHADAAYSHGDTPGHKTDRGRIYVRYGQPDEIDRPTPIQHQESRPYEHWQYANGEQYIFVDIRGANEYVLVWTNAMNERSQPTLYKYLPQELQDVVQ